MSKPLKGILKNPLDPKTPLLPKAPLLPVWKEAEEILRHVWLGALTENIKARKTNITEVICISKEPRSDLLRKGFRKASGLDSGTFTIESDTEGNMLEIFGEICDVIDGILLEEGGVLLLDVGGGVAAMAAYIMKKQDVSLPEAMLVITRARLKRENPKILPSKIIIEMLNNDIWLQQLEMWQACKYNIYDNTIVNPNDPREKWIVQKVSESPQKKSSDVPPALKRLGERFPQIADQPHRLSTIEEVEEEVRRLSMIQEEDDKETRRLRTIEQDEARRLGSTSRATLRGVEFDMLS